MSTVLQAFGLLILAAGFALIVPWLGLIVFGFELIAVGVALELRSRRAG